MGEPYAKAPWRAFWSYAHEDDDRYGGSITRLAQDVVTELASKQVCLHLFVDRSSIRWGVEWESRIAVALGEAVLLIPILTPQYFVRKNCRYELQSFFHRKSLGTGARMLPILYEDIRHFEASNRDKLVVRTARTQYIRMTGHASASPLERRRMVRHLANRLAAELAALEAHAHEQLTRRLNPIEHGQLMSALNQTAVLLPRLVASTEMERLMALQIDVSHDVVVRRCQTRPALTDYGSLDHHAAELLDKEQRRISFAKSQLEAARALDPLVRHALATVKGLPASRPLIAALEKGIGTVIARINEPGGRSRQEHNPSLKDARRLPEVAVLPTRTEAMLEEVRGIVYGWKERLEALPADSLGRSGNSAP